MLVEICFFNIFVQKLNNVIKQILKRVYSEQYPIAGPNIPQLLDSVQDILRLAFLTCIMWLSVTMLGMS